MARTLEFSSPGEKTDQIVDALQRTGSVVSLSLQRNASIEPPGDVVTIRTHNDGVRVLIAELTAQYPGVSYVTTGADSIVSPPASEKLQRENSESTWEEIAQFIRNESNLRHNYLGFMLLAGGIAAIGLWQNAPHIVVAATLVAPALLPLLRIPFGLVGGDRTMAGRGVASVVAGYLAVIAAALVTTAVLRAVQPMSLEMFRSLQWVRFWSSASGPAVVVAVIAAVAGVLAVGARSPVSIAGVLIALDLVPATSMIGMAVAMGDIGFALQNVGRVSLDVAIVLVVGGVALWVKRAVSHPEVKQRWRPPAARVT